MLEIKVLNESHIEEFIDHAHRHLGESSADTIIFHPVTYRPQSDREAYRKKLLPQWKKELHETGWQRVWGLWDHDKIVGHIQLTGGSLESDSHRAHLAMGIEWDYRGKGNGRQLMKTALSWSSEQSFIHWIDLEVFAHNISAVKLYQGLGFETVGVTKDRFRVEGHSIDDIHMVFKLKS